MLATDELRGVAEMTTTQQRLKFRRNPCSALWDKYASLLQVTMAVQNRHSRCLPLTHYFDKQGSVKGQGQGVRQGYGGEDGSEEDDGGGVMPISEEIQVQLMDLIQTCRHLSSNEDLGGNGMFAGGDQNDASEFLRFVFDMFHRALQRPASIRITGTAENEHELMAVRCWQYLSDIYQREYSEIFQRFYGVSVTYLYGQHDHLTRSLRPEHFFLCDLELPVVPEGASSVSLQDCLEFSTRPELLSGENAWINEARQNQRENVFKQQLFWSLPDVFIICLKRFSMTPTGHVYRNDTIVRFPVTDLLDMTPYMSEHAIFEDAAGTPVSFHYSLYGICNQHGSLHGGHYTAFVRVQNGTSEVCRGGGEGGWYFCDDAKVTPLSAEEVRSHTMHAAPYMLFYRRAPHPKHKVQAFNPPPSSTVAKQTQAPQHYRPHPHPHPHPHHHANRAA